MSKIYAIVGMCGSGKSEITKYLKEKYGWPSIYLGAITFEWMKERSIEVNYENEKNAREQIRRENGGIGAYALLSLPKIEEALKNSGTVIIESLYSWSEYKILKKKYGNDFKVIAAVASPQIRFERLTDRKNERPMNSWEEFQRRDYSEIENIEKGGPIAMADYVLLNDSDLKNLQKQIDSLKL